MQDRKAISRVVIAGGAGVLGLAIAGHLKAQGMSVTLLTRSLKPRVPFEQALWNGRSVEESWGKLLSGSILINLAGELVDRRPTRRNIALVKSSRTEPTLALVAAAKQHGKPALWLQSSTLAIYGDAGQRILDELAAPANGPEQMAGVAKAWERSVDSSRANRVVWMRTAVVLQANTPALNRLTNMTKMYLGGTVAKGTQWVSWIHMKDFLNAIDLLIADEGIDGPVHITSPNPVQNRDLMAALRSQLHRPWAPATPSILVKIGAWLLFRTDPALALTGRRAIPKRLVEHGFVFEHGELAEALKDLLGD